MVNLEQGGIAQIFSSLPEENVSFILMERLSLFETFPSPSSEGLLIQIGGRVIVLSFRFVQAAKDLIFLVLGSPVVPARSPFQKKDKLSYLFHGIV